MFCTVALLLSTLHIPAEVKGKKVALQDLPPAVYQTVQGLIAGAEMKGLSQEKENGRTVYEVETVKNGKTRDALIDTTGRILELEESTTLSEVPGPVKTAIEKAAGNGKITKIETITRGHSVRYEAIITKAGRSSELTFTGDGSIVQ